MPGFGPNSPLGSPNSGPSLADQLKCRLEERRRNSKEENSIPMQQSQPQMTNNPSNSALVPERMAQDIEQAVKVANENGNYI